MNFNLGLANYFGSTSLISEIKPSSNTFTKLSSRYGTVFCFDHIDCLHGSEINKNDKTMISIDFRLALAEIYFPSDAESKNMKSKFCPGGYFSADCIWLTVTKNYPKFRIRNEYDIPDPFFNDWSYYCLLKSFCVDSSLNYDEIDR